MKRMIGLILCASMLASGCGARSLSTAVQTRPGGTRVAEPQWVTREYVERVAIGSAVRVEQRTGESFTAIFMGLEGDAVRLQKRTRIPEAPVAIPLAELARLSLDSGGGIGAGKAVLIGLASGAAAFLSLLLLAAASWD
jgi:hypothetical protein